MDTLRSYPHGIHAIDSGYAGPLIDAIHLIVEGGRVALVDTALGELPSIAGSVEPPRHEGVALGIEQYNPHA